MSDNDYNNLTIRLGSEVYATLDKTVDEQTVLHDSNKVYTIGTSSTREDVLKLDYYPESSLVKLGDVKIKNINPTNNTETIEYKTIYIKTNEENLII